MKEEFLQLIHQFLAHVDKHNLDKKKPEHKQFFEDDIEPTFYNFYKWLLFEVNNN